MDHAQARELLELAAVEPGGLDRLMAGDTPDAIALAGHLAGCEACTAEFGRLRAASQVLREVIATEPSPDLRDRTLAMVAALGRPRGATVEAAAVAAGAAPAAVVGTAPGGFATSPADAPPHADAVPAPTPIRPAARSRVPRAVALLAAAAVLVIATAGTAAFTVSTVRDDAARQASRELEGLAEVASWTARLESEPGVQHITLVDTVAGATNQAIGSLVFSPETGDLVVVADGLPDPPPGREYGCWVDVNGSRQRVGRMYVSEGVAYWVGQSPALVDLPTGSTFGVSLGDPGGSAPAVPLLSGTLQSS